MSRLDKECKPTFIRSFERVCIYDSHPHQVAIGFFNEDKHPDLVVANSGTDCIGILMGHGNGTFATQITQSTGLGSRPFSIAVGDFNNDTELDVVVANYGINSVGVFLGHGNGSFASQIITSLGSAHPVSIAVEDFDNNKILDIAVANYGTLTVVILLGRNDGFFRTDAIYHMGYDSVPYSIAVADVNKDDILDLVVVNYGTSELVIVLRNTNGSFDIHRYSTGANSHPTAVAITNFDNDDALDIVVANSDTSNVAVFLGYRDGRFTNLTRYSTGFGSRPHSLIIGDLTNDTRLDIVLTDSRNNNILVLEGNRNRSFSLITTRSTGYNSDPCSIANGDFDNDDQLDIAIANNGANNILVLTSFHVYPTTTRAIYTTGEGSSPWSLHIHDLNKDNYLDAVVANAGSGTVGVFINLGNGTFRDQQIYNMGNGSGPIFVAVGDFDNDNHSDMVVVLFNVKKIGILLGYGDGTFRHRNMFSIAINYSRPYTASVGDFNSDGNLDFIVAHYDVGNIVIFFGYGDGTFTDMVSLIAQGSIRPKCADVSDFNNDNILDIAASDHKRGGIMILLGHGNGSFHKPILISTDDDCPNAFTIGDVNDDNLLDIAYADKVYGHVGVLLGSGNGTFGNLTKYGTVHGSYPWYLSIGYYNDDALVDIAVGTSYDSSIHIFTGIGNGLFGTPIRLSTGYSSYPWSVVFADIDNDRQQDIVVANDVTNNIMIFLVQNYYADFVNEVSYMMSVAPHPSAVNIANLDNDGKSNDVLLANPGNDNIELLYNYNNGVFINRTILSTGLGSRPKYVTTADLNRDHLLDIVAVNSGHNDLNIFFGLNDGSFNKKSVYASGGTLPNSIAIGDFNKDGREDLVIANEGTDNVAVFLAHDYVIFTNHTVKILEVSATPLYISTADFNNDGRLDIAAVSHRCDNPAVYLGYGDGTFSTQTTTLNTSTFSQRSLAIGDFNNDTYPDIVISDAVASIIGVYFGYGNGSFELPVLYSTGTSSSPYSVDVGDFDSNGALDIVVVNYNSNNVCIFYGNESGLYTEKIVYSLPIGSGPIWVTVTDLDNDTFLDIVVANFAGNNIYILFGDGDGYFRDNVTLPTGTDSGPCSIDIGDLNKDHSLDIIVANQMSKTIGIFFGNSNGTFSAQKVYFISSYANLSAIVVSDINNDTILDILVTDYNNLNSSIGIFYGYGDGIFTLPRIYPAGSITWSPGLAVGDFDNDNQTDLAVTNQQQNTINIMLQQKFDPFGSSKLFSTGNQSRPKSVATADFNNDDQLDIVVVNSGTNNIGILFGDRNGDFSDQLIYSTRSDFLPSSLAVGDFNNDHYVDIVVVNSATDSLNILLGYGNGTFANILTYPTGIHSDPSCVVVSDLNKDNHLDLIVSNLGINNILVFRGNGNGTFVKFHSYFLDYNTRPRSLAIGDMNNDGLLDIIIVNDGPNYIEILLQTC